MAINYRNTVTTAEGINSFDLDQHNGTTNNNASTETFTSFLNSSTRYIEQIALNFSSLLAGKKEGALAFCEESEGTAWLPYTVGGTYYPKGWYQWDGVQWISSKSNIAQALDAGTGSTGSIIQGDNISLLNNDAGYVTTDTNTQLTDQEVKDIISTEGYITTSFDGDYNSLTNTPTIPNEVTDNSNLTNGAGYITDNRNSSETMSFGDGSWMNIYHNTNAAVIQNTRGYFNIDSGAIAFRNAAGSLNYFTVNQSIATTGVPLNVNGQLGAAGGNSSQWNEAYNWGDHANANYVDSTAAIAFATGATLSSDQSKMNNNTTKTILAVGLTSTNRVALVSLGSGNMIEVYYNGSNFANGIVQYREFMELGEPICLSNVPNGAIITATEGVYGFSENHNGNDESPMPLLSLGLGFKESFVYASRDADTGDGFIHLVNGALDTHVTITKDGNTVLSQSNIPMDAWEHKTFDMDGVGEYFISSTNPVMGCTQSNNTSYYDLRLIMPMSQDSISYPRNGYLSTQYDNISFDYFDRSGNNGTSTVSSQNPVDLGSLINNVEDYLPNGATRIKSKGLTSWFSGDDSDGFESTPAQPIDSLSHIVAQPFYINDEGDGGNSGLAIASPYEGTAKVYSWDSSSNQANLAYTVPLTRGSAVPNVTLPEHQNYPASGLISNDTSVNGVVELVGRLDAGYIIADVPIYVVAQNGSQTLTPIVRSANGGNTIYIKSDDDETLLLGHTPALDKLEIIKDSAGLLRKRELNASGVVTYPLL